MSQRRSFHRGENSPDRLDSFPVRQNVLCLPIKSPLMPHLFDHFSCWAIKIFVPQIAFVLIRSARRWTASGLISERDVSTAKAVHEQQRWVGKDMATTGTDEL